MALRSMHGTCTLDTFIQYVANNQKKDAPLAIPRGLFSVESTPDGARQARTHELFDELVAFVLGHELAHHYLGHLPCTARPDALGTGQIGRVLSNAVPLFNQPNELAADVAGVNSILSASKRRPQGSPQMTENGGLLTMRFFSGLHQFSALDVLFAFELSHPPPNIRVPVIQQAANTWRLTGGAGLFIPRLGG
jgi:hypothetical protein